MTMETNRGISSFPENEAYAAFLRRRKTTATFWHAIFSLATMVGLLVLIVLVLDVANDAFGYVAIENAVEPEALVRDYYKDKLLNAPTTLASEDDNLLANGIAARPNAIGFFGYSYYKNNADRLTHLPVDGVEPSAETIESGVYSLARPLYLYTTQDLMREKPQVAAFLGYYLNNVNEIVGDVGYFEISPSTQEQNLEAWQGATGLTDSTAHNLDPAAGDILVVGSSTVAPLTGRMADEFAAAGNFAGQVQIESIGTDAGIRLFCIEGTGDILDASRSLVSIDRSACQKQLRYPIEFRIANDGLPIVVSSENDFLSGVTTDQLRQIFTTAEQWSDVDATWPDQPIFRFIPGADSGTLDFFVAQLFGTDLATQPAEMQQELLNTYVSAGRLNALEVEQPLTERSQESLHELLQAEVVKPKVVQTWSLFDSIFNRQEIEAEVASEMPSAELRFHSWVNWGFIASPQSSDPMKSGIRTAILGSLWVTIIAFLVAVPIGVAAAIYLEEYSTGQSRFDQFVETNINNLAGVPSIIYGMLGLAVFVRFLAPLTSGAAVGYTDPATANGRTIMSAGLTLAVLILPLVIINAREAIRAVPTHLREASYGLGATRWQTVWNHVLPNAISGILTGVILSVSRAFGETAPLIVVGVSTFIVVDPNTPFSKYTTLPAQIYQWTSRPQQEFQHLAAAAIIVLLLLLLLLNATAIYLRNRYSRRVL